MDGREYLWQGRVREVAMPVTLATGRRSLLWRDVFRGVTMPMSERPSRRRSESWSAAGRSWGTREGVKAPQRRTWAARRDLTQARRMRQTCVQGTGCDTLPIIPGTPAGTLSIDALLGYRLRCLVLKFWEI